MVRRKVGTSHSIHDQEIGLVALVSLFNRTCSFLALDEMSQSHTSHEYRHIHSVDQKQRSAFLSVLEQSVGNRRIWSW